MEGPSLVKHKIQHNFDFLQWSRDPGTPALRPWVPSRRQHKGTWNSSPTELGLDSDPPPRPSKVCGVTRLHLNATHID